MRVTDGCEHDRPASRKTDTFTGAAWQQMMLESEGGAARIISVFFEPGGRTHWHSHANGQLLMVTAGEGRVANDDGAHATLRPGDVVWASPGERHWHGAAPDSTFQHVAASLGGTEWDGSVDAEEYSRGF
ncbi:MAG: cupin domain-containing protein [Candidatus Dormibacteraeota bacterium]|uniref:Cupin domain-containing protein n=2 Tax=Candidatus Dormibacteria TaxID=3126996 RepID=A0A934JUS2_9BACT|nr:cupin domain-containing protein [Candidatus Dormibacteraeota bacterium]MBJ7603969.1 cupin domain-containing protein [Candidatus Dormibacteraeota bacterium]MBJ7607152.1 cupin domain-containing protein [Candidatus Dormibacteraeota bacterium]